MADFAVLASGSGSNFEAIVRAFDGSSHRVCCLVCDRKNAAVFERAARLGIESHHVTYFRRDREDAENEIQRILATYNPQLIVLAGFMRIFTTNFVEAHINSIVNIHPALLPLYPGAHGIADSFASGDTRLGITIHYVDGGVDTGPIIRQESFVRNEEDTLLMVEERIHALEHRVYPEVIRSILESRMLQKEVQS